MPLFRDAWRASVRVREPQRGPIRWPREGAAAAAADRCCHLAPARNLPIDLRPGKGNITDFNRLSRRTWTFPRTPPENKTRFEENRMLPRHYVVSLTRVVTFISRNERNKGELLLYSHCSSRERWRNSDHEGGALVDEPRKDYQAARFVRDQDRKIPGFRSHREAHSSLSLSLCSNGQ